MGRFEGKSALVTGAASGMGRATTLAFANEGANVLAVDIDADGLATLATEAAEASGSVVTHHAAIGTCDAGHAAVAAAVEAFGGLDVLANVAGVVRSAHTVDVTEDDWNLMFSVNVSGMFWLCQAALGAFDGGGVIVNVASNAGLMGPGLFRATAHPRGGGQPDQGAGHGVRQGQQHPHQRACSGSDRNADDRHHRAAHRL
ncbi:SDR family NAD(P)-dependent oxidoreductase [Candidatus Microthrix sp.]|uniref:SDR family NAD(P)-dependent oxidoreductase n=1 Tax=Candidatus Neomicrothrix sp. TaxID=2719034 RepID=UPI0025C01515|nr:SDR family oxidoreductase [Candidatus Microthrix sp.]